MKVISLRLTVLLLAPFCSEFCSDAAVAQEVAVRFKIFNADKPNSEPVGAAEALIFVRNQADREPVFYKRESLKDKKIKEGVDKDFYVIKLQKDQLFEQIVIKVQGLNFNPALIAKVVTRDNMTVYPGASDSNDDFSFQAFTGQLTLYRTIIGQLLDEYGDSQRTKIQQILQADFKNQLENMARLDLGKFTPQQQESARKLLNDVLVAYGLRADQPQIFIEFCPEPRYRFLGRHRVR